MKLSQRKPQRLKNYDYSQNGAYFITICTHNKLCLFGTNDNGKIILNNAGIMIYDKFEEMGKIFHGITIDKFIVMPNHLHAIMVIQNTGTARRPFENNGTVQGPFENTGTAQGPFENTGTAQGPFPTISEYVRRYKTYTTKLYIDGVKEGNYPRFDNRIWQKSFYDHIIRNEQDYERIWQYIDTNPLKWVDDVYYFE